MGCHFLYGGFLPLLQVWVFRSRYSALPFPAGQVSHNCKTYVKCKIPHFWILSAKGETCHFSGDKKALC